MLWPVSLVFHEQPVWRGQTKTRRYFALALWAGLVVSVSLPATGPFEVESGLLYNQEPSGEARRHPSKGPFSIEDQYVYYRIDWRNYQKGSEYKYEWIAPDGTIVSTYKNSRSENSNGGSWARLSAQTLFDHGGGVWQARFYYNNERKHSVKFEFRTAADFTHLLFTPDSPNLEAGVIVAVHSSSYNPIDYFNMFKGFAQKKRMVLVAPYFPKDTFSYQTIFRNTPRADLHLQKILDEVKTKTGANINKLYFYGQSAGGQFVHRYLLTHPDKVARIVISAPGWWTLPEFALAYPYGTGRDSRVPADIRFDVKRALQVPTMIIVGDGDVLRTSNLNQSAAADRQGQNRLQRSVYWLNQMAAVAIEEQVPLRHSYQLITGAGHGDVRGKSEEQVFDFLGRRDTNEQIAWTMQRVQGQSGSELKITLRSSRPPRYLEWGASPGALRRAPTSPWFKKGALYTSQLRLPAALQGMFLFARLRFVDNHLSNLQGIP
ncbi:MAG: hypothetical protein KDK39_00715 [Leptospiraceae bacterium]|nr:hypothetical protein [Leptospiraceae bacterium]